MSDKIKQGMNAVMERVSSIDIYQITGVDVDNQQYTIKQLNFNKVYRNVEVIGLGLGHGKGQLMLLEENDLVLVGFIMGSQTPYILGSIFNNFMTEKDYKIPIQPGEYFIGSKANGSYIYIKADGSINFPNYTMPSDDGTAGQVMATDGNGNITFQTAGGGGAVDSVNGETGVVVLSQDSILSGTTYVQTENNLTDSLVSDISTNTAKVTNATHTGEVTGATALTIADNVIDEANMKISNAPTDDYVLTADSAATGGWKWAEASGGGTPGGSDTEIQYNNSGAFDGITNVTTDGTDLFINGKQINIQTTAPTSPATGDIWIDIS